MEIGTLIVYMCMQLLPNAPMRKVTQCSMYLQSIVLITSDLDADDMKRVRNLTEKEQSAVAQGLVHLFGATPSKSPSTPKPNT